ncbi:hypothetical protein RM533_10115 [Croceicoccus sp. F390]|uniref:Uncharacterized protein n=1 Tax=Croceicoccus esteveae TaxID=3075597 RepID=A0ABU2ZJI5_9SPHN|nr:hypothetical protein [Croceicoccus sp. F390]MDT0576541.1 hypothetical protein [Croceicoccus sp. F390]
MEDRREKGARPASPLPFENRCTCLWNGSRSRRSAVLNAKKLSHTEYSPVGQRIRRDSAIISRPELSHPLFAAGFSVEFLANCANLVRLIGSSIQAASLLSDLADSPEEVRAEEY